MKKRIVVTGLGIISPVGNNVKDFWESLLGSKNGVGPIKQFDVSAFDSRIGGEVKDFNSLDHFNSKLTRRMDKFVQYSVVAAREAVKDSGLDLEKADRNRIGVIVGSGIGSLNTVEREYGNFLKYGPKKFSPFMIPLLIVNEAAGHISMDLKVKGPNSCVATACASGSHAIGDAFRILQHGDADVMLCGGTESAISPLGLGGFCALKACSTRNDDPQKASRPFDKERDGFVMAEGAGIVVLEELKHAKKRGARIYAECVGYGLSGDAYHITAPDPDGDGAARAMNMALFNAKVKPEEVDYINAHGTSTQLNDKVETMAIKKSFGQHAKKVAVSSTKSMTGHLLGAAGGVEFVACALAIRDNILPPTINYKHPDPECDLDYVPNKARQTKVDVAMSNSLGFGGHNATLLLKRFK